MMNSPLAYVVALVVLLCFFAAAVAAIVLREGNVAAASPVITTLLGLFGPTIALLVILVRQQHNIADVKEVKQLVNGHLEGLHNGESNTTSPPPAPGS